MRVFFSHESLSCSDSNFALMYNIFLGHLVLCRLTMFMAMMKLHSNALLETNSKFCYLPFNIRSRYRNTALHLRFTIEFVLFSQ